MNALKGIRFDVGPGINSGVEVEARLQFSSLAMGQDLDTAKEEAVELIRRQILGPIEDEIKTEMNKAHSKDIHDILEGLFDLTRPNKN